MLPAPQTPETSPLATHPIPAGPGTGASAPVGDAVLALDFYSDAPEGVLTIYAGERQILRESFHFFKKVSMFKSEPMSGTIEARRKLPAGATSMRIYLALGDKPARVTTLEGNFLGGSERVLKIRVSKDGQVTAGLN